VNFKPSDDKEAVPSLEIHKRLIYHAIPEGTELTPFLGALIGFSKRMIVDDPKTEGRLEKLKTPSFLKLFIASHCVFCPKMVQDLIPMAIANELVNLTIIDGFMFPEMAEPFDIKSAPTLILNEHMRWSGLTPVDEIAGVMINQDPSQLSAGSIESLLGDGRADLVAQMMMAAGKVFPAFIEMLAHEKWPVRLGAMVAMEEIIERDRELAQQCIEPLWERFPHLNEQVQGDVIYILGETGTGDVIPRLQAVLKDVTDADTDTREAVNEAIETITKRM
jgi:thiol-disulfide isomerase/thioredoxin